MKRIRRVQSDDEDSDKDGEREGDEQERIANELFEGDDEGEEEDDDAKSRMTRAETEAQDLAVEGSDEEDGNDFIKKTTLVLSINSVYVFILDYDITSLE